MSQIIAWLGSPQDDLHRQAAESIIDLWIHDAELGEGVARMAWIGDGLIDDEAEALASLLKLAKSEPNLTGLLIQLPWIGETPGKTPGGIEWVLFRLLLDIGRHSPELGLLLTTHPLLADDVTHEEWELAELLIETGRRDLELARRLATTDWVSDGISRDELRVLFSAVPTADSPASPSEFLLGLPSLTDHLTGNLGDYVTRELTNLALGKPENLKQVVGQGWFADGLAAEEAVLIVILARASWESPELFQDLLAERFTQTTTIDLPLTGPVRLWAVQNTPSPKGEALLQRMEEAVRYWEGLVQKPFPTDEVILSVVDPEGKSYGLHGGAHLVTHMRLIRDVTLGTVSDVPHETGHYLFGFPRWFGEGVSQFGQSHLGHLNGVQSLEERREELASSTTCSRYANIRHFEYEIADSNLLTFDLCPHHLGENFMLSVLSLIGQEAMSATLRNLYVLYRDDKQPITDEAIYNAFLRNAPSDKQAAFRDLFRRLHGGAFTLQDTSFADDHGDKAADASIAVVGQSLSGELDYLFDFDYFRFQVQEGQKYRVTVQHPTLPPDWVTIYAPDGVTRETDGLKSRSGTPSGPEWLWIAPTTGEYYFVVRNFAGITGAYTLSIAHVEDTSDDHGDTAASATPLNLGQTGTGAVDNAFDLDYFRFQAQRGQWVRMVVRGVTLESLTVVLSEADGATPARMRREDAQAIVDDGGEWVDIIDLRNLSWPQVSSFTWVAPRAGEFFLTVSNIEGMVGTYVVTITRIDR